MLNIINAKEKKIRHDDGTRMDIVSYRLGIELEK